MGNRAYLTTVPDVLIAGTDDVVIAKQLGSKFDKPFRNVVVVRQTDIMPVNHSFYTRPKKPLLNGDIYTLMTSTTPDTSQDVIREYNERANVRVADDHVAISQWTHERACQVLGITGLYR